jgi:hypothetical protein
MISGAYGVWIFTNVRSSNDRLGTVFPLDWCDADIAGTCCRKTTVGIDCDG